MLTRWVYPVLLAWFGLGCSEPSGRDLQQPYSADESTPAQMPANMDCQGTPPSYEQVAAFKQCVMCHASSKSGAQRNSAAVDVNFDTQAGAEAHAMRAATVVMAGIMPPRDSGIQLSDMDKQQLYEWAMCTM